MALTEAEFQQLLDNQQRATGTPPVAPAFPRAAERGPQMNKTEAKFAQWLDLQKAAGVVKEWWFEAMRIRVGYDCWWNPDFLVALVCPGNHTSLVLYDTKGTKRNKRTGKTGPYAEEDAVVKARAIADRFPIPVYFAWQEKNGEWSFRRM